MQVLFISQKNSNEYIYHYTKSETATDFILKNKNLRFSAFNETNDPKETKDWLLIPDTNEGRDLTQYTPEYLSKRLNPYFKESTRLLCFSKDQELTGNHLEDTPKRGFCKPRMWAQYAGNHTGICLIFDSERFTKNFHDKFYDKEYTYNHVDYYDRLLADTQLEQAYMINIDYLGEKGDRDYSNEHLFKFNKRLFFEKAKDWENENEFRFAIFECNEELYFEYRNSLRGIVFGQDCKESNVKRIVELTKNDGIQYRKLRWRNCTPWFEFERTKWL